MPHRTTKSPRLTALAVLGSCLSAVPSLASDWPQWRGPQRDGISQESGLLKQWPAEGPKLLWQVNDIGDGYSTPSVVGTRIYLMSNRGMENEFVQALSTEDGKPIWTTRVGNVGNPNQEPPYPKARSTPTVDGDFSTRWAPTATWSAWKPRRQGSLAEEPAQGVRRQAGRVGLCRVSAGRW